MKKTELEILQEKLDAAIADREKAYTYAANGESIHAVADYAAATAAVCVARAAHASPAADLATLAADAAATRSRCLSDSADYRARSSDDAHALVFRAYGSPIYDKVAANADAAATTARAARNAADAAANAATRTSHAARDAHIALTRSRAAADAVSEFSNKLIELIKYA